MAETAFNEAAERGGALVFRLVRSLAAVENGETRCCGVTTRQGLALLAMKPGRQVNMCQVADALGVSAGTATRVIDNLVRDGRVERAGNPADRRNVCVQPTARGERTIKELTECYSRFWEMTFSDVDRSRLVETLATLEVVVNAVEKARKACCGTHNVRNTHIQRGGAYGMAEEAE